MLHSTVMRSTERRFFVVNTSIKVKIVVCVLATLLSLSTTMANENLKAVVDGNNQLTNKLYANVAKPNENLIFSPLSVHTILSLVYQGSNGATETAFKNALNIPDKAKTANGYETVMQQLLNVENVTLDIANRVYIKEGYTMKDNFKSVATKEFQAGAENLDFAKSDAAAKTINSWVEDKTRQKIKDLIKSSDLDDLTRMVLVNAIYFKGNWEHQFNKDLTRPDKFYTSETDTVPCDMMFRNGKYNYKEDETLDAQIIQLPYKNPALSMVIVLPKTKTGITALEQKLSTYDLTQLTKGMHNVEVDLSLPKFKIESELNLNDALQKMGLENAFGDNADFSELLTSPEPLKISKVIQKAFIEVNEEGAEAAAATGAIMMMRCMPISLPPPIIYYANHPFVFTLLSNEVDNTGKVLFYGKLNKFL